MGDGIDADIRVRCDELRRLAALKQYTIDSYRDQMRSGIAAVTQPQLGWMRVTVTAVDEAFRSVKVCLSIGARK